MKRLPLIAATFTAVMFLYGCDSNSNNSPQQYIVTLSPSPTEAGSVSAEEQMYDEGSIATIAATPATNWVFVRWEGDYSGTSSTATVTVDSDLDITAIFEKKSYALTVNTSGEGSVNEKVIQNKLTDYKHGTEVELTANPAEDWGFKEWQGAVTGSTNPVEITVEGPKQVTAVFSQVYLAANGVTVKCEDAKVGATGTVKGITYTKRTIEQITPSNAPTTCTSGITDMSGLFQNASSFNGDISHWDVSSVTDMGSMFWHAEAFNQPIGSWDVSNVKFMFNMFYHAHSFNQPIDNWDVSSVTTMFNMFYQAWSFNQPIGTWDVSSLTDMGYMFSNALSFNQDLNSWNVSSALNMGYMFSGASSFNGDISNWDVSAVTSMTSMFSNASLFNQDLSGWNVSNVTDMSSMFSFSSFNGDISGWDVSSVTDMTFMFGNTTSFNQDIGNWDVSAVTSMISMFSNASSFNQDLTGWCVSNISSEPTDFSTGSPLTNSNKPVWGTCPGS